MSENIDITKACKLFSSFLELISSMSAKEIKELSNEIQYNNLNVKEKKALKLLLESDNQSYSELVNTFKFEFIMNKLRNAIAHGLIMDNDYDDIKWLLRIMIKSSELFKDTKEIDNFLSNITGLKHDTKSTGRDRIVDWYFKQLDNMQDYERNSILRQIAKYLFINIPSNYKEWNKVLYKKGR